MPRTRVPGRKADLPWRAFRTVSLKLRHKLILSPTSPFLLPPGPPLTWSLQPGTSSRPWRQCQNMAPLGSAARSPAAHSWAHHTASSVRSATCPLCSPCHRSAQMPWTWAPLWHSQCPERVAALRVWSTTPISGRALDTSSAPLRGKGTICQRCGDTRSLGSTGGKLRLL